MRSNVISRIQKICIRNKVDETSKVSPYYQVIDYYQIYFIRKYLKNMHSKFFFENISKCILESLGINLKISFDKTMIQKFNDCKKNIKYNSVINFFKINPYQKTGVICISYSVVAILIESLFGGSKLLNSYSKISYKKLTVFEISVVSKFFNIILRQYCCLWNKELLSNIEFNLSYFKSEDKIHTINSINSDSDMYTTFFFHIRIGKICEFISISLPISISIQLKNKLYNQERISNSVSDLNETKRLLQLVINDCKIILKIILVESNLEFSKILNLKVGDIFMIHISSNIIAYSENVPLLIGQYQKYKNKHAFFVTSFLNSIVNSKNG